MKTKSAKIIEDISWKNACICKYAAILRTCDEKYIDILEEELQLHRIERYRLIEELNRVLND